MLWERIDELLERAPHVRALRFHRLELLEVRRRRCAGLPALAELAAEAAQAVIADLAVPALLTRARDVCDGRLVLVKGPELALDYPGPGLRRFGDLDLLADDPATAQAAMLAAGFQEVGDPALYEDIHHLRPLGWPGLPLIVELHSRPKWPELLPAPAVAELLEAAVPSRLGVAGIETLPAAHHAVLVAAHSWAHEPLARIGHLVDVAVTLDRADRADVRAIARAWGARRAWDCTEAAVDTVVHGHGRSAAAAVWARHLRPVRERTVLESHMQEWLAPVWGLPAHRMPQALGRALRDELRRESAESWRTKLARSRIAVGNAGLARADHDLALEARGHTLRGTTEAR